MDPGKIEYIIETSRKIKDDKKTLGDNELEDKYSDFSEKYPKIWLAIKDNVFDENMLKSMVKVYNKTYSKTTGNDLMRKTKSDISVGELLAEKYLYKNGTRPDSQSKQEAYKKIMKKVKDQQQK